MPSRLVNGVSVSMTQAEVDALNQGVTVTADDVRREGQRRIDAIAPQYLEGERTTWASQEAELAAFDADSSATTPYIDALASGRDETRAQAAERIRANATAFKAASAAIIGKQVALLDTDPIPADYAADSNWT